MSTLTTPALSTLLDRLFIDAAATQAALESRMEKLSPAERAAAFGKPEDYRAFYARTKDYHLAVSRETATLLYMLARSAKATSIVEFGMSFGISTLHLAAALEDNGGGRVITTEFEQSKVAHARANFEAAGLAHRVEIREGDALETLARNLPDSIDLVLLDGAKSLYPRVLSLLAPRLHAGSLVIADNADWCPEYLAHVRAAGGDYLSVPFAEDVELSMKIR
jgi:predicted O-methyltransferase YrrM